MRIYYLENKKDIVLSKIKKPNDDFLKQRYIYLGSTDINFEQYKIYSNSKNCIYFLSDKNSFRTTILYLNELVYNVNYNIREYGNNWYEN
jgi:hypothetical protein